MQEIQQEFNFKKFMILTLPITLQVLLRNIVGVTDNFMVGLLGPDYMAALRIATSYFFFFIVLLFAFSNAGSIIAGQLWGKGKKDDYYKVCAATLFISSIIALLLGLVMFYGSRLSISIMINDEKIIEYGTVYMRIIAFCFILTGISIALSITFTSQGDTRTPFYQQIVTTVLNVVFNYLLIFGKMGFPRMGVAGAAWSSLISTVAGLFYIVFTAFRKGYLPDIFYIIKPEIKKIKEILKIGLPVLGDMFFWQFAMMVYLKFIGMAGSEAVAVYGVVGLFFSLLFLTVSGFVTGTGISVAQIIGSGNNDNAIKFGYKSLFSAMIIGALAGVVLIVSSPLIPGIFKLEGDAYYHCIICLIILGFRQPFATANGVLPSAIRAGKDTKSPLITSFAAFAFIGLPLSFIAGPILKFGIIGIFSAMTIEEISKSVIFFLRYRTGRWIKNIDNIVLNSDGEEMLRADLIADEI